MKLKNEFLIREFNGTIYAVCSELQGENGSEPIILNGTGRRMWQLLQNETNEETLVDALLSEYDIDRQTAEKDVAAFIEELRKAELLSEQA